MIVGQSPPGSALRRAMGDGWTLADHLLASVVDVLALANWQRQGKKGATRPKPLPRPGVTSDTEHVGSDPIPISEFDTWWVEEGEVRPWQTQLS